MPKKKPEKTKAVEEDFGISISEFFAISRRLEIHHSVFYKLWELGIPVFTRSIPTAAVRFDKEGNCIQFMFNPDFWKGLSDVERDFVICHECLHVVLDHGTRARDGFVKDRERCNVAMDVVVNEMLIDKFGFNKDDVDLDRKLCWLDTVFDPPEGPDQTFEYYFNRIPETKKCRIIVDIHDFLDGSESEALKDVLDGLSDEEQDDLKKAIKDHIEKDHAMSRGNAAGSGVRVMNKDKVRQKRKWETVIRRWTKKLLKNEFDYFEQWARVNRRMVMLPEDVILPSEMEIQEREDDGKIQVYFFLDTSGSCSHLADRFWRAAMSVPRSRFDKRLFCFDTKVYAVNEKDRKLYGFGGTRFDVIENQIQLDLKKGVIKSYPQAVFIITDGYGSAVKPERPERWHWFLSIYGDGASYIKQLVPASSKLYKLSDYE